MWLEQPTRKEISIKIVTEISLPSSLPSLEFAPQTSKLSNKEQQLMMFNERKTVDNLQFLLEMKFAATNRLRSCLLCPSSTAKKDSYLADVKIEAFLSHLKINYAGLSVCTCNVVSNSNFAKTCCPAFKPQTVIGNCDIVANWVNSKSTHGSNLR